MFGKLFGKEKTGKGSIETILNAAKMMGLDIPKMAQEKIPELVASAKTFQERAGFPLFISIALDEPAEHFVLSLWKVGGDGADMLKSYRLTDLQTFISQLQFDLNNITDDTNTPETEQLTISGAGRTNDDAAGTNGNAYIDAGTATEL